MSILAFVRSLVPPWYSPLRVACPGFSTVVFFIVGGMPWLLQLSDFVTLNPHWCFTSTCISITEVGFSEDRVRGQLHLEAINFQRHSDGRL